MSERKHTPDIPEDLASCQALIEQLTHAIDELEQQKQHLEQDKQELELTITQLLKRFQRRRERYIEDPNQLKIDFGDSAMAADAAEELSQAVEEAQQKEAQQTVASYNRRPKRKTRSENLPEHLPRYEVIAQVPDEVKVCPEHGERTLVGYDTVETLEFKRPELRVRVTKFAKYACQNSSPCGIASPERPTGLVEGNRYDTSVAAEVVVGKYGYHMPIYRQQDYFAGSGWTPARSVLLNILTATAFVIRPLVEYFRQTAIASPILGTDDTGVTLLLPKEIPGPDPRNPKSVRIHEVMSKAAHKGKPSIAARMWAYRSVTVPLNVFDFTVSHHRDGPDLMLADFQGKLMADCYSGYQGIGLRSCGQVQRGACVAHARRKVFDARQTYRRESSIVLAKFGQLYDIEDRAQKFSPDERLALRQKEAVVVWEALGHWLESDAARAVLPTSDFGKALAYLRNHWEPLQLYLTDGRMPMDNNDVEQLMKQVALGRKNWLFVGSVAAGERAADFLTLVSSALRNDLCVWTYVKDVLDQLLAGSTEYEPLRPDVWKLSHPEAVRHYRTTERRDRADRKQFRRAQRRIQHAASLA